MAAVTSNFISLLTADIKRQARNSSEKIMKERAITTEVKKVLKIT
jgi:hypothetical protein